MGVRYWLDATGPILHCRLESRDTRVPLRCAAMAEVYKTLTDIDAFFHQWANRFA